MFITIVEDCPGFHLTCLGLNSDQTVNTRLALRSLEVQLQFAFIAFITARFGVSQGMARARWGWAAPPTRK